MPNWAAYNFYYMVLTWVKQKNVACSWYFIPQCAFHADVGLLLADCFPDSMYICMNRGQFVFVHPIVTARNNATILFEPLSKLKRQPEEVAVAEARIAEVIVMEDGFTNSFLICFDVACKCIFICLFNICFICLINLTKVILLDRRMW